MTEVYLIRHSEKYKDVCNIMNDDSFQLCNEKIVLSVNGEMLASKLANIKEMENIDCVFASNYVRSIGTAKYIADKNNIGVKIDKDFGERIYGINSIDEIISGFEYKQWEDIDYKFTNGESRRYVTDRMYSALNRVLKNYKNKRVVIVSHGTAISFLLGKWCDVLLYYDSSSKINTKIIFNDKTIFDGNFKAPEVFKLTFNNDAEIIDIKNINIH